MSTTMTQRIGTLPITQLIPDERYQPRDGRSEAHVRLLMASDPATWPPLTVSPTGDGAFVIIDGFHRWEAASRLGLDALPCRVVPDAGYPEAFAANLSHGLPLSLAERKAFARWLAVEEPWLSYRELARRSGLSDKTIKRALIEEERAESPHSAPTPMARLVGQVYRLFDGDSIDVHGLRTEIAAYDDEWQPEVARALLTVGHACVAAAQPYLAGEEG
jgi:ParB-like chromosome segregation protein Spo0J